MYSSNTILCDCCRLPSFTEEQKKWLKGTSDFLALNFYSVSYAEHHDLSREENVTWGYFTDQEMKASRDPTWLKGQWIVGRWANLTCCGPLTLFPSGLAFLVPISEFLNITYVVFKQV